MSNSYEFVGEFLNYLSLLRVYHWQTKKYSRHVASGDYYEKINDLIDTFVETFMGKYERFSFPEKKTVHYINISDQQVNNILDSFTEYLENILPKYYTEKDTDLASIRDDLLTESKKLKYLFTLD